MKRLFLVAVALSLASLPVLAETYNIDPMHSNVNFSIRHMVGHVTGHFNTVEGSFAYDPANPASWIAKATIDAASINTGIEKRDAHLRTPDFFDVVKYPTLTFQSTKISDVQGKKAKLYGNLTMHGVTKPVVLDLELTDAVKDPFGTGKRIGATATGKISRKEFGIWAKDEKKMEAGDLMVGEDVAITLNIEGVSSK